MSNHPGMGVLIGMLGGNEDTIAAMRGALGKVIESAKLVDDALVFRFADGGELRIWDDGQSCCESRYMQTDDDLTPFAGATLVNLSVRDGDYQPSEDEEAHEVQFLVVDTSKGSFTMASHVEHNGYYGGFWLQATFAEHVDAEG